MKTKIKTIINKLLTKNTTEKPQKKEYYFRVYRWMSMLPISGYEKMVYAYIHGYNYHGRGYCYVAEQLGGGVFGVSAETMNSIMDKLVEKGYLFKDAQGLFWCDKFRERRQKNMSNN